MHYKTIVLQLLEDRPRLKSRLQKYRQLGTTLDFYAQELKTSHEHWQRSLARQRPGSDPRQLASEALELAIAEIRDRLSSESAANETSDHLPSPSSNE